MQSNDVSKEELQQLADLAGVELVFQDDSPEANDQAVETNIPLGPDPIALLISQMTQVVMNGGGDEFAMFAAQNKDRIGHAAANHPEVADALVTCYKIGIGTGSAACMNDLGALYYMGDIVEQDYHMAAELYEEAMDHGCYQSIINLGYIYEYGRTGEPDYAAAYRFYSLAAALSPSCEAVYKLGDMFSRGRGVPDDKAKAYYLYERSLSLANSEVEVAQPAIRIANIIMEDDCESYGVERDFLRALALYQQAEIGLRIDIADGQMYYIKRLREAIDGQQRVRALLSPRHY